MIARLPLPLTITLGLLAAGAAAFVSVLARFWGANPEYSDRFLVLVAAGWVAWQRKAELAALAARPFHAGWPLLVAGATAFPLGWYLQAQVGQKPAIIWWLALSWLSVAAGFVLLAGGCGHLRRLAFTLLFVLFSLPLPNRVLGPLQFVLQTATTSTSAAILPMLGIATERSGFALYLPGGPMEVADACSGVRSVTALTALAAFVACLKDFGPGRGGALLLLSIPVIAAVNICRVVISGVIQETLGTPYILGTWHEALGVAMIFLGLGLIMAVARLFERPDSRVSASEASFVENPMTRNEIEATKPSIGRPWAFWSDESMNLKRRSILVLPAFLLSLSAAATAAAQFLGEGVEQAAAATARLDDFPLVIGDWKGEVAPIDDRITDILTCDSMIQRTYTDPIGYRTGISIAFWSSQHLVKGYHHPDICMPNQGFRELPAGRGLISIPLESGGVIPVTIREYGHGNERRLVLYWTQEGRRVWTEEDERAAQISGDSYRWLTDRLFNRSAAPESDARLVVLLFAPIWGDGDSIRKETLNFTRQVAESLYLLCPWARPSSLPRRD